MIRKLQLKDAEQMFLCMSDYNVTHFMNIGGNGLTLDDCKSYIQKSLNDDKNHHFAIVDENDIWVGTISLKSIDCKTSSAEYAIITKASVHGKGVAMKATKEILDYAFNKLSLNRVYLNVLKENERANNFYKKAGFTYEGCFRKAIFVKNEIHDLNWYSILKDEFKSE